MSALELPSLLVGGFLTLLLALVGRFLWKYIEQALNGSANLLWFVTHEASYELPKEIDNHLFEIYRSARDADANIMDRDQFFDLKQSINRGYETTGIVIHNLGKIPANEVSILLSKEPLRIRVSSDVAVHQKETADGNVELRLGAIEPSNQVKVTFFGIAAFQVRSVTLNGVKVNEYNRPDLIPLRYLEEKKFNSKNRLWNTITVALLVIVTSIAVFDAASSVLNREPENAEKTGTSSASK